MPLCSKCPAGEEIKATNDETGEVLTEIVNSHEGHYIKPLSQIILQAHDEYEQLMRELKQRTEKIDAAVSYYGGLEEMFVWQKDFFIKKLNTDFDNLV